MMTGQDLSITDKEKNITLTDYSISDIHHSTFNSNTHAESVIPFDAKEISDRVE